MKNFKKILFIFVLVLSVSFLGSCDELLSKAFEKDITEECLVHNYEVYKHVESTCLSEGYTTYKCTKCGKVTERFYEELLEHTPSDPDDYASYQECSVCHQFFKQDSVDSILDHLDFYIDQAFVDETLQYATDMTLILDSYKDETDPDIIAAIGDQIDAKFQLLEDNVEIIIQQYYAAEGAFSIDTTNETYISNQEFVQESYNLIYQTYRYTLYRCFYSNFQSYLFGDDPEDLAYWEEELKYCSDQTYAELSDQIDDLTYDILYEDLTQEEIYSSVSTIISLRNQLAVSQGYDNYYNYACDKEYHREYGAEQIAEFRELCKTKLFPLMMEIYWQYYSLASRVSEDDSDWLASLDSTSIFEDTNHVTYDYAMSYFKTIKNDKYGVDMYACVNDAYKNGCYIVGDADVSEEGAYTRVGYDWHNFCFFYDSGYYASPLTFVHETGHLNAGKISINDFDLKELQSQGNESLFLSYCLENYASNDEKARDHAYAEVYTTVNNIYSALINTIVDEFEYSLYINYSDLDECLKDGITSDEYSILWNKIIRSYNNGTYSMYSFLGPYTSSYENYWLYYFADRSCYEVSYGISYIPTLELYVDAMFDYDYAVEEYCKAIAYANQEDFTGNGYMLSVLDYAGLSSPFTADVYDKFTAYFVLNDVSAIYGIR